MTCRVARPSLNLPLIDLVFCCECGSGDLEMCYASKALGPHLCPYCAHSMVECGASNKTPTQSQMTEQPVA